MKSLILRWLLRRKALSRWRWARQFRAYLTLDFRSLALFRIFFALLLISDWFARWPNLEAFYTSFGVLPIEVPLPKAGGVFHFSILDSFTTLPMVKLFFILGLIWYLCFLIGYRTKWFQVFSFFFFISVSNRNIVIRDGSDLVMAALFFWSLFLPLGKRFSLDNVIEKLRKDLPPENNDHHQERSATQTEPSIAAFAILFQVASIYFVSAITKNGPSWKDGTAIYYALEHNHFVRPLSHFLLAQPLWCIKMMTWGTLILEYASLPLLLAPFWQPYLRRIGIFALCILQLGIFAFMDIGHFPCVMIASMLLFLGEEEWKLLCGLALRWAKAVTVYYDDTCGFCTKCCQLLAMADVGRNITFIGSSDETQFKHSLERSQLDVSIVVFEEGTQRKLDRAPAMARILGALPFPLNLFQVIVFSPFRSVSNWVYDWTARNRHKISTALGMKACGIKPPDVSSDTSSKSTEHTSLLGKVRWFSINLIVTWCFVAIVWEGYNLNIAPAWNLKYIPEPTSIQAFVQSSQLIQDWHMFSPDPAKDAGWWVIDGVTERGEPFDPLTGATPRFTAPYIVPKQFDRFWRKYLYRLWLRDYADYRLYFAQYITRKNHREMPIGHRLKEFKFYYLLQTTLPPGSPKPFPTEAILLWHHLCFSH